MLGGGIHPIVNTGLPEVDLGDIPLLVRHGIVTACVVDRIGQPGACQVVNGELTVFFSKEKLGDMVPKRASNSARVTSYFQCPLSTHIW